MIVQLRHRAQEPRSWRDRSVGRGGAERQRDRAPTHRVRSTGRLPLPGPRRQRVRHLGDDDARFVLRKAQYVGWLAGRWASV